MILIQPSNKRLPTNSQEQRNLDDFREIPCKDLDLDCFGLDGKTPFGSYHRCYDYAPELGRCVFCQDIN